MMPDEIYQAWAKGFAEQDLEAILALYAPDATLESPLVNNLLGTEVGIVAGRDELRKFFRIILRSTPSLKDRYRANFFTNGKVMIWEYPRVTPTGEQTDLTEIMELQDGADPGAPHLLGLGRHQADELQKDQYRTG